MRTIEIIFRGCALKIKYDDSDWWAIDESDLLNIILHEEYDIEISNLVAEKERELARSGEL